MNFLKTHQWLVITVIVAVTFLYSYSRLISYLEANAKLEATKAQIALEAQQEHNKELAAQSELAFDRYEKLVETLTAENKALIAGQTKRAVETVKQQQVDKTLPPNQLAARWVSLVPAISTTAETITPTETGYDVKPEAAIATVVALEQLPTLQADLRDEKQISQNKSTQILEQAKVVDALNQQVGGLGGEIAAQTEACKTEVALVKAEARKSKMRWFLIGGIVGAVVRGIAGI